MRLERISENQIRCTLTAGDLAERDLKISELAYGTAGAKALFKDVMKRAYDQLGFEAENMPLMIEAVPISPDCLMLIVTKVNDPEELDTRFSRFTTPPEDMEDEYGTGLLDDVVSHDEVMDIFKQLTADIIAKAGKMKAAEEEDSPEATPESENVLHIRYFEFKEIDQICRAAALIPADTVCDSMLYRNTATRKLYLVITSEELSQDIFKAICGRLSEYGKPVAAGVNTIFYLDEHYETIIPENALGILRNL